MAFIKDKILGKIRRKFLLKEPWQTHSMDNNCSKKIETNKAKSLNF